MYSAVQIHVRIYEESMLGCRNGEEKRHRKRKGERQRERERKREKSVTKVK